MNIGVSAILLAAGESRRMGQQKALLEWRGVPLVAYQLSQLTAVDAVREIVVVVGHEPERIEEIAGGYARTLVVRNAEYRSGKASSIRAGLHAASEETDAFLVLAVDQPRSSSVLRAIVEAHATSGAAITVPAHGGRRGHPPVLARWLLPELLAIREETRGLRAVMRAHAKEVHEVPCDASVLIDLNQPEDLRAARAAGDRA